VRQRVDLDEGVVLDHVVHQDGAAGHEDQRDADHEREHRLALVAGMLETPAQVPPSVSEGLWEEGSEEGSGELCGHRPHPTVAS
jgi:hypothetical protein